MKSGLKTKIITLIIGIAVTLTALVSLAFSIYPFLFSSFAPKTVIEVLTWINFILPIIGIAAMFIFIYRRERNYK